MLSYLTCGYVVLMAVYLLAVRGYEGIQGLKTPLFYLICGGYAGAVILICLESLLLGLTDPRTLLNKLKPTSPAQIMMLCYLAFTLVSTILSEHPTVWLGNLRNEGLLSIGIYVLSFYFLSKFVKPAKWMIYLFGGAVTVMCLLSIIQLLGSPLLYPAGMNYYDGYVKYAGAYVGTLGNVDFVATFLALCIPALALYITVTKDPHRFWLLIPLALCIAVLLGIWVLMGLVGVAAAIVLIPPFALHLKTRDRIIYFVFIGALAAVGVAVLYAVPFASGLPSELHNILHGNVSETFGSGRLHIWSEVLRRVPENLLFGAGPESLLYANIAPFTRVDETYGNIISFIDNAHNDYLNILYNQGLLAMLAYVGALGSMGISFFKKASISKGVLIAGGAIIGYAVSAFFGVSSVIHTPFFWLCLGIFEYYNNEGEHTK